MVDHTDSKPDREEHLLLKGIDDAFKKVLKENKAFIAGGAITSVFSGAAIRDYDVYCKTSVGVGVIMGYLYKDMYESKNNTSFIVETDCAATYKRNGATYQIIKMPDMVGEPEKIVKKFDFTICQGAYDFEFNDFFMSLNFLKDIAQRRLVFNVNSEYPICSLFRARKYMARGYKLSGIEALKIGLRIEKLHMTTYADLRRQMMGIDTLFLRELTDQLNEPEKAAQAYDFNKAMQLIEEHVMKMYNEEEETV